MKTRKNTGLSVVGFFFLISLLAGMLSCSGNVQSSIQDTNEKMDRLNEKVSRMDRAAEDTANASQTLINHDPQSPFEEIKFDEAYDHILDEKYFRYPIPFPVEILPYARTIASKGTNEQILHIIQAWYQSNWTVQTTLSMQKPALDAGVRERADIFRLSRVQAIKGVCGQIPSETWERIFREYLMRPSEFNEAVSVCRWARAAFLTGQLLVEANYNAVILQDSIERALELQTLFLVEHKSQISADLHFSFYSKTYNQFMAEQNPVKAEDIRLIWDSLDQAPEVIENKDPFTDKNKLEQLRSKIRVERSRFLQEMKL